MIRIAVVGQHVDSQDLVLVAGGGIGIGLRARVDQIDSQRFKVSRREVHGGKFEGPAVSRVLAVMEVVVMPVPAV